MVEIITSTPTSTPASTFKWAKDGGSTETIQPTYILSEEKRPQLSEVAPGSIPLIDLSEPEEIIREKVVKASEEYGIFYLVNHGVDPELCNETLKAIVEFFQLPLEQGRGLLHSTDHKKDVKIYNYHEPDGDKRVPGWSEALTHLWHPSDDSFLDALPANIPPQYRYHFSSFFPDI